MEAADISRRLTSLTPQRLHKPASLRRFPSSQRFDRIFSNEGVCRSTSPTGCQTPD